MDEIFGNDRDPKAIKTMLALMDQVDLWEEDKIPTELVVKFA